MYDVTYMFLTWELAGTCDFLSAIPVMYGTLIYTSFVPHLYLIYTSFVPHSYLIYTSFIPHLYLRGAKSKSKGQLASPSYPPPSSSLGESLPPVPPHPPSFPPSASSFSPSVSSFQPPPSPQSPNSATYSDPTLLYPGDDMQQELYGEQL